MSEALAPVERTDLERHEDAIKRGMGTFVEVGRALQAIRDGRLYREQFATFESYCRERWSYARNYANKLIASADAAQSLGTKVPTPATESVARSLSAVKDLAKRREVWEEAVETAPNQNPTAKHVKAVADGLEPKRAQRGGVAKDTFRAPQPMYVLDRAVEAFETNVYALDRVADDLGVVSPEIVTRLRSVRTKLGQFIRHIEREDNAQDQGE